MKDYRFEKGDIAILVKGGGGFCKAAEPYLYSEVEIVSALRTWPEEVISGPAHHIRTADGHDFLAMPCCLRKRKGKDNKERLGEWELCPWQPKESREEYLKRTWCPEKVPT